MHCFLHKKVSLALEILEKRNKIITESPQHVVKWHNFFPDSPYRFTREIMDLAMFIFEKKDLTNVILASKPCFEVPWLKSILRCVFSKTRQGIEFHVRGLSVVDKSVMQKKATFAGSNIVWLNVAFFLFYNIFVWRGRQNQY